MYIRYRLPIAFDEVIIPKMLLPDEVMDRIFAHDRVGARVCSRAHADRVKRMKLDPHKLSRPLKMRDVESFVRLDDTESKWMTLLGMAVDDGAEDVANYLFRKVDDPEWIGYYAVEVNHLGIMKMVSKALNEGDADLAHVILEGILCKASESCNADMFKYMLENMFPPTTPLDSMSVSSCASLDVAEYVVSRARITDDVVDVLHESFMCSGCPNCFVKWMHVLRKAVDVCNEGICFDFRDLTYARFFHESVLEVLCTFEDAVADIPSENGYAFNADDTKKFLYILSQMGCECNAPALYDTLFVAFE